jgi:hypothetical protein
MWLHCDRKNMAPNPPACVLQLLQCLLHIPLGDELGPRTSGPVLCFVVLLLGDGAVADLRSDDAK